MRGSKISQGMRVAQILHLLITKGAKSFPELKKHFPGVSDSAINRDLKILFDADLIIKRREQRRFNGKITRKVYCFFFDKKDVKGAVLKTMRSLKNRGYEQVTLDRIASIAGFPPGEIDEIAYALAPKLDLLIGQECREAPPDPLMAGFSGTTEKNAGQSARA